jgi:archaetidylserine synthase
MNVFREMRPPDLFTLLNAMLGFAAVVAASLGEVRISVILILSAAVADGLDGFLARRMGAGPLGSNLDSLADLVSFGVAPAALVLTGFGMPWPAWTLGGVYLACGMLRLARFNISSKNDLFFEGLPIPAAGIILAASVLLDAREMTIALILLLSALMVSSFSYPKIRDLKFASILAVIFLAAAFMIWIEDFSGVAAIVFYAAAALYLFSPVVMPYLQKGR